MEQLLIYPGQMLLPWWSLRVIP